MFSFRILKEMRTPLNEWIKAFFIEKTIFTRPAFYSSFPYIYTQTSHFFTTFLRFFSINTIMHLNRKSYYTVHAKYSSHYTAYSSKTFLQNTIKSITSFHQNYIILWCLCTSRPTLIPANKLQCTKLVKTLRKHSQASIPYTIYKSVRDRPVIDTLFRVSMDIFSTL